MYFVLTHVWLFEWMLFLAKLNLKAYSYCFAEILESLVHQDILVTVLISVSSFLLSV